MLFEINVFVRPAGIAYKRLTVFHGMSVVVRGRVGSAPDLLKENSRPRLAVTPKTSRLEKMRVRGRKKMRGRCEARFRSLRLSPSACPPRIRRLFSPPSLSLSLSFIYYFVISCRYLDWEGFFFFLKSLVG